MQDFLIININQDKSDTKLFILIGRVFHDYLTTNRWVTVDKLLMT